MRKYKARIADKILEKRLLGKGAVLIEGAKWCGKTTTDEQIARSILYMADPKKEQQNLTMAEISPGRLLKGKSPDVYKRQVLRSCGMTGEPERRQII